MPLSLQPPSAIPAPQPRGFALSQIFPLPFAFRLLGPDPFRLSVLGPLLGLPSLPVGPHLLGEVVPVQPVEGAAEPVHEPGRVVPLSLPV